MHLEKKRTARLEREREKSTDRHTDILVPPSPPLNSFPLWFSRRLLKYWVCHDIPSAKPALYIHAARAPEGGVSEGSIFCVLRLLRKEAGRGGGGEAFADIFDAGGGREAELRREGAERRGDNV